MADGARRSRALILCAVFSTTLGYSGFGFAQTSDAEAVARSAERQKQQKQKQSKRKPAKPQEQAATAPVLNARAQIGATPVQSLDTITVAASKTEERAIDALAPVSVVTLEQIQGLQPNRLADIFYNVPGVSFQDRGDDASTAINIRGLQDFGRVAVVVDGARQNYQRSGHNANGSFFLDPELVGGVDIVRGPTANIYGSGAIGGVVSFRTKDINDVVRPGERWGVDMTGSYGTNKDRGLGSVFGGVRVNPDVDVFGGAVYRTQGNYKDGNGTEIGNTGNEIASGLMKLTVRPAEGHEIKFGAVFQDDKYNIGQFNRGPVLTAAQRALYQGSSVYASDAKNYTGTVTWKYSKPDDMWFDWSATLYGNRTDNDQTKTYHYSATASGAAFCGNGSFGNNISGCVGDKRGYVLDTVGVDVYNTTRFNVGDWRNALTVGFDAFQDDVNTTDSRGNSNITTPSGLRTVSGGFAQLKNNYSTWLEIVSAIRYDRYDLHSPTVSTGGGGDRFSPKITVGVTPVPGFTPYVSYAEGYRAPSITETLISGAHATGGSPAFFPCPDGTTGLFCFLPNPNLQPEVGKNKEAGLNLKYDGIFAASDSFRGKFNVFRNDIDNYIDLVASAPVPTPFGSFSQYYQYQNITHARIEGFEAETLYDAGSWFVGVAGHLIRGKNAVTNVGLATITPRKVVTTAGLRLLDRKLVISAQWASFGANNDLPAGYLPSTSYELVNLYLTYQATKDITLTASVDNLLNQYYRPYAIPGNSTDGTTLNDALWSSPGPGRVYKAGLKIHLGGA
jgi:hemoglobin/transferrin/lactoferrin receptor protein